MRNSFIIPDFQHLLELQGISTDKVVIISIIGKTVQGSYGYKIKSIGKIPFTRNISNKECSIEGSYDEENQIVYLHLYSLLDTDIFIENFQTFSSKIKSDKDCDDFLAVYDEIKTVFAKALLILFHVSHVIVLSHPGTTFDTDFIQYFKAVDSMSQKLFDKIGDELKTIEGISSQWVNNGRFCTPRLLFYFERYPKGVENVKKLEHNLEDKIFHILKKTRIISTTGGSLFSIPLNDEFVFMSEEQPVDPLGDAVRGLLQDCQPGGVMKIEVPFSCRPDDEKSFRKFLQVHIKQAKNKGFEDTVSSSRGQHTHLHFELPTLKQWIQSTTLIHALVSKKKKISSLCTDTRFSEQRCLKVLPLALARYQENHPSHYARAEHEARLNSATALFRAQARGPNYRRFAEQLEAECLAFWESGRQQCEAASMTGNPCKLPKHSGEQEHMSGFIYKAVCDCGRKIGPREDPYNAKQANYLFYQQISKECQCSKLERIQFPTFEPSSKDYKAATLTETEEPLSSLLSDHSSDFSPERNSLVRQPSTTEYLPGMLTTISPPGLLPAYSSWSLVCLGASSLYSHNLGLSDSHHPGFISSTNYLLPWDVTVYSKSKQFIGKYTAIRGRRGRPNTGLPQFTVKVFIGVEYECSLGHRFMLAAPDRMLKATPGSIVKDTGHKVAESDMPLYYPCACRSGKIAQLMRLHVVTPKAPVHCTLDPKVQPAQGSPTFIPTTEGTIKLTQSAYWILRLPYVYVTDKEHFAQNLSAKLLRGVFGVTEIEQ